MENQHKNDVELTVDVVKTYITAYFSRPNAPTMQAQNIDTLIKSVYESISKLGQE